MVAPSKPKAVWPAKIDGRRSLAPDVFRQAGGCDTDCQVLIQWDALTLGDNIAHVAPDGHHLASRIGRALNESSTADEWLNHVHVKPLLRAVQTYHKELTNRKADNG